MITIEQFWAIMSLLFAVILGTFGWALWVAREIASLKVTAKNNRDLINMADANHRSELIKEIQERGAVAQGLQETNRHIFERLDVIVSITSEINTAMGRHDERIKHLEIKTLSHI